MDHQTCDPVTGSCLACGCRRGDLDDGVACDPVPPGPNRIAIMALKRELREFDDSILSLERTLRSYQDAIPGITQGLQEKRALREALAASIAKLAGDGGAAGFDFGALAKLRQTGSGY